eukprot:GHVT01065839.1.p1 GENE.GHVT01065839.1~~GHVT01065839.1.p1  ORF type:complete len:386 (-),score=35.69 GHVT01065839.1:294-1415(-)
MADPLECPSFAQKALEKSEELERSLDGSSPHRAQAGALCNKTAGSSNQGTWVPGAGKIVLLCLGLTAGLAFSRLKVRPDASWVAGQWPSLPKQQVGDSTVQAATSTPHLPPPVAPLVMPIIPPPPPAAAEVGAPETALLSPTEMNDLSECLKPETAWGGGFASTSNTTRDFLRNRHRTAPGRRLGQRNCIQLISKYLFVVSFLLLVIQAVMAGYTGICHSCGIVDLWKVDMNGECPIVYQGGNPNTFTGQKHDSCVDSPPAGSSPIECSRQWGVKTDLNCKMAYSLNGSEWFHYAYTKFITFGFRIMNASTKNGTPICSTPVAGPRPILNNRCTILPITSDANPASASVKLPINYYQVLLLVVFAMLNIIPSL